MISTRSRSPSRSASRSSASVPSMVMSNVPRDSILLVRFREATLSASSMIPRSKVLKAPKSSSPNIAMSTSGRKKVQKMAWRSRNQMRMEARVKLSVGLD